jgi:hypothetical protein
VEEESEAKPVAVCPCNNPECPGKGGGFYVLAVRQHETVLVAGPFETHEEAIARVADAWRLGWEDDPLDDAKWTSGRKNRPPYPPGLWNERLGVTKA